MKLEVIYHAGDTGNWVSLPIESGNYSQLAYDSSSFDYSISQIKKLIADFDSGKSDYEPSPGIKSLLQTGLAYIPIGHHPTKGDYWAELPARPNATKIKYYIVFQDGTRLPWIETYEAGEIIDIDELLEIAGK